MDGEEIEMHDYTVYDDDDDDEETPFLGERSIQQELQHSADVDDFYESIIRETPYRKDYDNFYIREDGKFVKTDRGLVRLTYKDNPNNFLAKTTLQRSMGVDRFRKVFNLQDMDTRSLSKEGFKDFQKFLNKLPTDRLVETTPRNELPSVAENLSRSIETLAEEDPMQSNLPLRDILALDRSLQSIRGESG